MAAHPINKQGLFVHDNTAAPEHPSLMSMFSLKGKTAIVSGAGAGIGLAVAQGLAEAGANIALWYNSNPKCEERAAEIAQKYNVQGTRIRSLPPFSKTKLTYGLPITAKAYKVQVTDAKAVEEAVNTVVKDFNGRLDVFIANAGIPWTQGPMVDGSLEHYRDVINVDLDGTFYCARAAAAHWRRQKEEGTDANGNKLTNFTYGSFVATASMSGHIVNFPQLQSAYNAAKSAVIHLCTSMSSLYLIPIELC